MTSVYLRIVVALGILAPALAAAEDFDPLEPDGWPVGYTVVRLRHLPACGPEGLPRVPGAVITCRPRYSTRMPQWSLSADWTTGATFGDVPTLGGAHGFGVEANLALLRWVQLGGRYELLALRLPGPAEDNAYANHFFGHLKLRYFTDEVTREGWTIGAGYGWALRSDELGEDGAIVRVSLAREVGLDLQNRRTAMTAALELAYERSLLDARLDAALASIRLGFETQVRPAANLGEPEPDRWHRTGSLDAFAPGGFGLSFGLRATPNLSLETSGSYLVDLEGQSWRGFKEASWAAQTGVRYQLLSWPADFIPLYLQVQGGVAWYAREPEGKLEPIQTAEIGVRGLCSARRGSIAFDLGGWVRTHIDDSDKLEALAAGLVVRLVLGADRTAIGGTGKPCGGAGSTGTATAELRLAGGPSSSASSTSSTSSGGTTITLQPPRIDVTVPTGIDVNVDVRDQRPTSPPPPPRVEAVTGRPGFVWIAGHWAWRGQWEWTPGHWERERAGEVWIPARWQLEGQRYVWIAGRWERAAAPPPPPPPPPHVRDHRRR